MDKIEIATAVARVLTNIGRERSEVHTLGMEFQRHRAATINMGGAPGKNMNLAMTALGDAYALLTQAEANLITAKRAMQQ